MPAKGFGGKAAVSRIKDQLRILRRMIRAIVGRDLSYHAEVRLPVEHHGSEYGGWTIYPRDIDSSSIIYSFGAGEDVSFDLSLIGTFGATVHVFDPTPKSIAWISGQSLPHGFIFHPLGVASINGVKTFHPPIQPGFASFTSLEQEGDTTADVALEVRRVETLMQELGHDHIDLMKMDVEGAEYEVLEDVLRSGLDVRQILVEFHHRFSSISLQKTIASVERLKVAGYRLFYVSPKGEEFSFVREDVISGR